MTWSMRGDRRSSRGSRWGTIAIAVGLLAAAFTSAPAELVERVTLCQGSGCDGADLVLETATDLGFSVAMGYLNNDTIADIALGAPGDGRVWVLLGGRGDYNGVSLGDAEFVFCPGPCANDHSATQFGYSLGIAYRGVALPTNSPLIVGAPAGAAQGRGRAYVIPASFMSTAGPGDAQTAVNVLADVPGVAILEGVDPAGGSNDEAGYSVALGPVLNVGSDDYVVGARLADDGRGAVYVVPGGTSGTVDLDGGGASTKISGPQQRVVQPSPAPVISGSALGEFIALGDFLAGGTLEIAASGVGTDPDDTNNVPGSTWVVPSVCAGAPATTCATSLDCGAAAPCGLPAGTIDLSLPATVALEIVGDSDKSTVVPAVPDGTNDFFGFSLTAAPFDGGPGHDLAIGAIYADRPADACLPGQSQQKNAGAIYLFTDADLGLAGLGGNTSIVASGASQTYYGFRAWDELGFALSHGDVDGDGDYDLVATARRHDRQQGNFNEVDEGIGYVFYDPIPGGTECLDCATSACTGPQPYGRIFGGDYNGMASDEVGYSVAVGDFNHDNQYADVVITTTTNDRAYVVSMNDHDRDGVRDVEDIDDDNDGILDSDEGFGDDDGDGVPNSMDIDSDDDGITDNVEAQSSAGYRAPQRNDADGDGLDDEYDADSGGTPIPLPLVDTDGDNAPDYLDADSDASGVPDSTEGHDADRNGVADTVPAGADTDGDGLDDAYDVRDLLGVSPAGNATSGNAPLQNSDGTDVPDWRDRDNDNDGLLDFSEGTGDSDADGWRDYFDIDSDADGIVDNVEAQTTPGYRAPQGADGDADGLDDEYDADSGGTPIPVPFADSDADNIRDYLDSDSDANGVPDSTEGHDANRDGAADLTPFLSDGDSDGLDDVYDTVNRLSPGNETGSKAALQNTDGVDNQDWRDRDNDNDGLLDGVDGLTDGPDADGLANHYDIDSDGDGLTDGREGPRASLFVAPSGADADLDGLDDSYEPNGVTPVDTDGDAAFDYLDTDSDATGPPDRVEGHDFNFDALSDVSPLLGDADGDGLDDAYTMPATAPPDFDGDGVGDWRDRDNDDDGLVDMDDGQADADGDNLPNYYDIDSDGDGIVDNREAQSTAGYLAPLNADADEDGLDNRYDPDFGGSSPITTPTNTDAVNGPDYLDTDSDNNGVPDSNEGNDANMDGVADAVASGVDDDNDGLDNVYDIRTRGTDADNETGSNVALQDSDADLEPDWRDLDDDGDGLLDTGEAAAGTSRLNPDTDGDNVSDGAADPDGAGPIAAGPDNCPLTPNTAQTDTDGDGMGDACDADDDNDGTLDATDNCPLTKNSGQQNNDGDAEGDACDPDDDNDTVLDGADNCPFDANMAQTDTDGDGRGDACDTDDDNDGVLDDGDMSGDPTDNPCNGTPTTGCDDNCPLIPNSGQQDGDGDGLGDVCDPSPPSAPTNPEVGFATADRLQWNNVNGAVAYHIYRGDLTELQTTGVYTQDPATSPNAEKFCFHGANELDDTFSPAVGTAVYYLVSTDDGNVEGDLGRDGDGANRPNDNPCR